MYRTSSPAYTPPKGRPTPKRDNRYRQPNPMAVKLLLCMNALGMPMYEGTVPWAVTRRRRAANRVARRSRQINRR